MMNELEKVIAVYECWNGSYERGKCDHCLYGYSYWDDSGDGSGQYSCDEEKWEKDAYVWLKIYQHLIKEKDNND